MVGWGEGDRVVSRILALAGKEGKREAKALVHHASLLVARDEYIF